MNSQTLNYPGALRHAPAAARSAIGLLARLRHGSLTVQLPDGSIQVFGDAAHNDAHRTNEHAQPGAMIMLRNWNMCVATLKSGDIGFAESYIAGDWSTPNLTDLLRLFIRNRNELEDVIYGSWAGRALYRVKHWLNRNTRANSQKNIHAHYDLGNAFYSLWLDDTMNYSSALFEGEYGRSMRDAQNAKVRRALRMAGVRTGDRVLEIGCGWGALAEMATTEFGASVTGVTLSTEQLEFARARISRRAAPKANSSEVRSTEEHLVSRRAAPKANSSEVRSTEEHLISRRAAPKVDGMPASVDLRLQDYRDIDDGPYDAICSIEMVEAVGRAYWPTYFRSVHRLLKPGGRACVQSIVIDDALFDRYVRSSDFIQQYIFPGGCLPCPSAFRREAATAGLTVVDELAFGQDYAETLRRWRHDFLANREAIGQLGFDARFMRIWEFYLAYCEAAFDMGNIDVVQYTLVRS